MDKETWIIILVAFLYLRQASQVIQALVRPVLSHHPAIRVDSRVHGFQG